MNSQESLNNTTTEIERVIPRRLHCLYSQKLMFKNKTCPIIMRRSLCSRSFNMVTPTKLNSKNKRFSNKVLQSLKTNHSLSSFAFRYGFQNINEVTFIADIIKHFRRLTSLQLRILNDSTSLERFNHLARSLRFLPFLKSLDFAVSYQESPGVEEFKLTDTLKSLKSLHTLSLNFSWGRTIKVDKICEGLKTMTNLTNLTLTFSFVNIEDRDVIILADCLTNLKGLKHLKVDLSNNSISQIGLRALITSLKELTNLKELELICNKNLILVEDMTFFKESMQALVQLEVLQLNFSNIKIFKDSIKHFGEGLAYLTSLKVLKVSFSDCHLNDKCIGNIGKGISELKTLVEIDFDMTHNELNDKETLEFIESLKPLSEMRRFSLSLSQNLLGDWILFTLGRMLASYRNLEKIALNGFSCRITDKGIEKLTLLTERLYNLKELTLIFNNNTNIQEEGVKKFMDGLVKIKGLEEIRIDFAECKLSQDLEDFYLSELKKELPNCHTTILFGY